MRRQGKREEVLYRESWEEMNERIRFMLTFCGLGFLFRVSNMQEMRYRVWNLVRGDAMNKPACFPACRLDECIAPAWNNST